MSSAISFATSVRGCPVVGRRAHVARRVAPVVTRCNADIMSEVGSLRLTENQLQASRYVASNRFKLQKNKGPTFEKRWAERKSRLANLDGFRFFTLMRRVLPLRHRRFRRTHCPARQAMIPQTGQACPGRSDE